MEEKIQKIGREEVGFFKNLREMKDAPKILYFRGELPKDNEK